MARFRSKDVSRGCHARDDSAAFNGEPPRPLAVTQPVRQRRGGFFVCVLQAGRMCSSPPMTPNAPTPTSPATMYSLIQLCLASGRGWPTSGSSNQSITRSRQVMLMGSERSTSVSRHSDDLGRSTDCWRLRRASSSIPSFHRITGDDASGHQPVRSPRLKFGKARL